MRRRLDSRSLLLALAFTPLTGCATSALSRAPDRPDHPVALAPAATGGPSEASPPSRPNVPAANEESPSAADASSAPTATTGLTRFTVDTRRHYGLAALIDIAERRHPETREAWERARQAALGVGLAESAYLPQITAQVIAGLQHTPIPIPKNVNPDGYFLSNSREIVPMLTAKWLLFDFGHREDGIEAAKARSFAANVAFNAAHQRIIYDVSRDYYALGSARALLRVAQQAKTNADVILDAAQTRKDHGLATVVEVAQARRQSAQARYNVVRADGAERSAYTSLVASMGIEPSAELLVADSSESTLPAPSEEVERQIQDALLNQPDVRAAVVTTQALEATVRQAKAEFYPRIGLDATVFQNVGEINTDGSEYYRVNEPGASVLVSISVPVFDGGERSAHVAVAQSQLAAAEAAVEHARTEVRRRITEADDTLRTSYASYKAAEAVVQAAEMAHDSALDAYRQGVGTYTDLVSSETSVTQARTEKETAHADILSAAVSLAFATGTLGGPH